MKSNNLKAKVRVWYHDWEEGPRVAKSSEWSRLLSKLDAYIIVSNKYVII